MKIAVLKRTMQVARVLKQHHVLHLLFEMNPSQGTLARTARRLWPHQNMSHAQQAHQLRLALESLGPIFIKLGQVLSTRPDILPAEYIEELSHLQDRITPVPAATIRAIIEAELGQPVDEIFSAFDDDNVATASVAQVHRATVREGEWAGREVAVKVLRPDIDELIKVDIECMYTAARYFEKNHIDGKRLKPVEVIAQVERHLQQELDLQCESANASQLRHNMQGSDLIAVPEICWNHTAQRVMVMEWMYGVPVSRLDKLAEMNVDLKRLARDGVEIFFTQVFRDGFFHADMHPGNVFVGTQGTQRGHYIALDCGIVGTLSEVDRHYLAINFLAFFNRDYRGVAYAHIESGWVPADTPLDQLTTTVRTVCEPYFGRPISEISLGQVLMRLFDVSRQFNVSVQPQLVMLQKTLLNVEGMGRVLDPNLDLWQTAKPFLEKWMRNTLGPKGLWRGLKREWPYIVRHLPDAPRLLLGALQAQKGSDSQVSMQRLTELEARVERQSRQLMLWKWIGALVLVGVVGLVIWMQR